MLFENLGAIVAEVTPRIGAANDDVDFGFLPQLCITGVMFEDTNANGVRDAGEPPLANVVLKARNTASTSALDSVTTGADGTYTICSDTDGLTPGMYVVTLDTCQTAVGQRALTTPNVGSDDTRDSDFGAAPSPCGESSVTVNVPCWTCGPIEGKTDGGFRAPGATVGELLWLDENNDGIRDPNEPPVRGVTVGVCNATTGEVLGSAVTGLFLCFIFKKYINLIFYFS